MRYLVIVCTLLVLAGCSSRETYVMMVDAMVAPDVPAAGSYVLRPGSRSVEDDDLRFREFAGYIHRAMAMAGYAEATGTDAAGLVVQVDYGVSPPQEHVYAESEPQFGSFGLGYGSGPWPRYGGYSTYGVTGYSTRVESYSTYTRSLLLRAFAAEAAGSERGPERWRVLVQSTGRSSDLRKVFPYLVAAAQPYIGRSTGREAVTVELKENDERVARIRGLAESPALSPAGTAPPATP